MCPDEVHISGHLKWVVYAFLAMNIAREMMGNQSQNIQHEKAVMDY